MKPVEWINNCLTVGGFPALVNHLFDFSQHDIVINVSNQYSINNENQIIERFNRSYWFPMNECTADIGINSIYAACVILYRAEQRNLKVYLHCWAGINRSQTVKAAYYFMRTGKHFNSGNGKWINMLYANCSYGHLPEIKKMERLLLGLNEKLNSKLPCDGTLDQLKIDLNEKT